MSGRGPPVVLVAGVDPRRGARTLTVALQEQDAATGKTPVILAEGVDPRRVIRTLTVTLQEEVVFARHWPFSNRLRNALRSHRRFDILTRSSMICKGGRCFSHAVRRYSCNVTVTNQSDAPWIHAFGEDDEVCDRG